MSDACVGLAGTLLTDIRRGTHNLQHSGSFSDELSPRAGRPPKALFLFLMVIITLNIIIQAQIAG